jgi:hypothetical protein
VGVEDRTDKSDDYVQFDGMPPFAVEVDPSIPLGNEETPYLRHGHDQGKFRQEKKLQYCTVMINVQIICVIFYECIPLVI